MLDIKDRQLDNQKAQVLTYANIVANKDLEINGLRSTKNLLIKQFYQSEKEFKRDKRKAWWRGVKQGFIIGAALGVSGTVYFQSI